jgi:hypothetical protein
MRQTLELLQKISAGVPCDKLLVILTEEGLEFRALMGRRGFSYTFTRREIINSKTDHLTDKFIHTANESLRASEPLHNESATGR